MAPMRVFAAMLASAGVAADDSLSLVQRALSVDQAQEMDMQMYKDEDQLEWVFPKFPRPTPTWTFGRAMKPAGLFPAFFRRTDNTTSENSTQLAVNASKPSASLESAAPKAPVQKSTLASAKQQPAAAHNASKQAQSNFEVPSWVYPLVDTTVFFPFSDNATWVIIPRRNAVCMEGPRVYMNKVLDRLRASPMKSGYLEGTSWFMKGSCAFLGYRTQMEQKCFPRLKLYSDENRAHQQFLVRMKDTFIKEWMEKNDKNTLDVAEHMKKVCVA